MRVAVLSLLVCLVFSGIAVCQSGEEVSREDLPSFSANAVAIYSWEGRFKVATSPDGRKTVRIKVLDNDKAEDFPAILTVDTGRTQLTAMIHFGLDTEVLWSPDSAAFAITGSCCGANGQYQVDVFTLTKNLLVKTKLTGLVERAFGHPVKCSWPEPPNVAAIKWLIPSKEILVAAEIMHHSNCDSYGTFTAYAIELSGRRIVKRFDQLEAKGLFGADLGPELLQADDKCIHDPKACWVMGNH